MIGYVCGLLHSSSFLPFTTTTTTTTKIYTVSRDGALLCWVRKHDKSGWSLEAKHYFNQNAKVTSASFNKRNNMLVVGFSSGIFALYELPDFSTIHTLSISSKKINTVRAEKLCVCVCVARAH